MTTETPKKKKSLIRRILKWTGITFLVLLVLIIAAPFLFKKQIVQLVKDKANENLNAKVNFGEFGLTLITSFPDFTLSIDDLSIANVGEFEGDTLVYTKNLTIGLNLMSVIKGEQYQINTISLNNPRIHALVLKNGKANWDITKPSADTAVATPTNETSAPFKMTLKKFEIENGYIVYDDASMDFKTELVNMNHTLSGDFTSDNFLLETLTEIEKFSMSYGGVSYMNKVKTRLKVDLDADMPNFKFTFKENEFSFNELTLGLDGFFAMPKEDMDMDLKFKANQTEFKNILSLVPGVYTADFKSVKTSGLLSLDGFAKGIYNDKKMPAFGLKLNIKDAMFQYPSLPKAVTNIQVDLAVNNKTGVPDATVIDLNRFHIEMAGNPVDAKLHLSTPVSDANIKAEILAKINIASVKDVIPLEKGDDLNGMVTADIKMNGRMSSIEKEQYEKFEAKGNLTILDMNYKTATLNYPTKINKLYLNFTPQFVELSQFDAKVGKSDIQLDGRIENFLQYALKDSLLSGAFNFKSSLLDLNEFMAEDETAAAKPVAADTAPMTVVEVPSNLDVRLTASIGKMLYDNLVITNVSGGVKVKNSQATLDNLKMDLKEQEGTMILSGSYNTQNIKKPAVDFDIDIANFDIAKTFKAFNSVQKLAPIGKYAKGKFGTQMKFKAQLDTHMEPDLTTLTGGGRLTTTNVVVEGFEPINKLADALKQPKYKRLAFENINATYQFKNGRVEVEEMPVKMGTISGTVKGSTGFDQTIDYIWTLEIPRAEFGTQANAAAGSVIDQLNKQAGTNVKLADKIKIKALFGGTVTKPTIKTDLLGSQTKEDIKEQVKEQVKEVITKGIDDAKEKARAEADKIMRDAQAQAAKIKSEAQALADKTRAEGYAVVDKTVNDAKNPIAKNAAKIAAPSAKKEVDKKVAKILEEADKKSNSVLSNAKAESDKKLQ
ncbi:MAG: AsmA-like C-terminal region-containing protein [Bacteroidota bacterium]